MKSPMGVMGAGLLVALSMAWWSSACGIDDGARGCDSNADCREGRTCIDSVCVSTDLFDPEANNANNTSNGSPTTDPINNPTNNDTPTNNNATTTNNTTTTNPIDDPACADDEIVDTVDGVEGCYQICDDEDTVCRERRFLCSDAGESGIDLCVEPLRCTDFFSDRSETTCGWEWSCSDRRLAYSATCEVTDAFGVASQCRCEVNGEGFGFSRDENVCDILDATRFFNDACGWRIAP